MHNAGNIEKRKRIPKIPSHARLKQDLLTFVWRTHLDVGGAYDYFPLNKIRTLFFYVFLSHNILKNSITNIWLVKEDFKHI